MADEPTRTLPPDSNPKHAAATGAVQAPPTGAAPQVLGSVPSASQAETLEHVGSEWVTPEPSPQMAPTLDGPPPTSPAMLLLRRHFGDYELLEEMARGGMGVVFKAQQISLHRIVALKMILAGHLASREQVRRFHLEAEEAGHLDHPNIVPIYQVGEQDGQHYFTMKLIEGGNLAQQVKDKPMSVTDAVRLVAKMARAVHYAHQRGILHRDLKPGNILLDAAGEPHITDFGLAKHLTGPGGQAPEGASTQSGAVVGTPSYMAPEQAAARKDLSVAVDVYSLGAILFELLTGQPPFKAETPIDTILQVLEKDPPCPRSLNPQLDKDIEIITLKCLEKAPQHRYGSAARLAEDLDRYLAGEPIQARPASVVERTVKWARRRPTAAALVAVCGLAFIAFLAFGWWTNLRLNTMLAQTEAEREEVIRQEQAVAIERDRVKANLQKRLDIIDDFLMRMDDRLQRQNVPAPLRVEFLHDAQELSKGVLNEDPNNQNAQRQLGSLYFRIADLYRRGRLFPESNTAFRNALQMQQALAQAQPENPELQHDVAVTSSRHAKLLQDHGRFEEGLKAIDRAIDLEDRLVKETSEEPKYVRAGAYYRFRRADLLETADRKKEGEQGYHDALDRQERLVAAHPEVYAHHQDLAATASSLAALRAETDPRAAVPLRQRAVQAWRRVAILTRSRKPYSGGLEDTYFDLIALLRRCTMHAELLQLAEELRNDAPNDSGAAYDAACVAANSVQAVRDCKDLSEMERSRLADRHAEQAVKMLSMAIHEGYRNHVHMAKDSDLDPLRARADYRELIGRLEERLPAPRLTPAQELAAMQEEYDNAKGNYDYLVRRAETVAERKRAEAKKPNFEEFVARCSKFAEQHKDSSAAVDALVWVLENSAPNRGEQIPPPTLRLRERALALLERDHFAKPEMASVCQRLSESPAPDCQKLLQAAMAKHAHHDVQGLAGYALALSLARQADAAREAGSAEAAGLFQEAEKQLGKVIQDYADVPTGQTNLGDVARAKLSALRHLSVGRPAQDIEGQTLDGKPMKLSDFRGKVVVLAFWADWCGYCRQMYAQQHSLVERLKDRPFAVVGVNCDDDKERAKHVMDRARFNWRNWWDGDKSAGERITKAWQVDGFPTIYVLDAKGIIRYKDKRGEELEEAVDKLLAEK
jgi:peroxiredoxin